MIAQHLLIRADASVEIGTGHVMRCLALAQAWQDMGGAVTFCCASLPAALASRLAAEGVAVRMIDVDPGTSADAGDVIRLAGEIAASAVVVDGYVFGAAYQRRLKAAGLRLLFIDDNVHAEHYTADFVLNQNAYADSLTYPRTSETRLLLGTPYTLLRREFLANRSPEREIPVSAGKVLVTLGGSDPQNVTMSVIEALSGLPFETTVIVGASNPHRDVLQRAAGELGIRVEVSVTDMPHWMNWAELAVTAAGSTCWETARMGLPGIALVIADNQQRIGTWLESQRLAVVLNQDVAPVQLRQAIVDLAGDSDLRRMMSLIGQATIDGRGAWRVAAVLRGETHSGLRPVDSGDRGLVWLWANDPQTRANSFNKSPIPWENHCRWFDQQISAPDVRFWMLEDLAAPVGHIRYHTEADGKTATIGFTVGPQYRGKGYGTRLLRDSVERVCRELGVEALEGVAYADNVASAVAFRKAGFAQTETRRVNERPCLVFQWRCN